VTISITIRAGDASVTRHARIRGRVISERFGKINVIITNTAKFVGPRDVVDGVIYNLRDLILLVRVLVRRRDEHGLLQLRTLLVAFDLEVDPIIA